MSIFEVIFHARSSTDGDSVGRTKQLRQEDTETESDIYMLNSNQSYANSKMTPRQMQHLANQLPGYAEINATINLSNTDFDDDYLYFLTLALSKCTEGSLTIDLSNNNISQEGLDFLAIAFSYISIPVNICLINNSKIELDYFFKVKNNLKIELSNFKLDILRIAMKYSILSTLPKELLKYIYNLYFYLDQFVIAKGATNPNQLPQLVKFNNADYLKNLQGAIGCVCVCNDTKKIQISYHDNNLIIFVKSKSSKYFDAITNFCTNQFGFNKSDFQIETLRNQLIFTGLAAEIFAINMEKQYPTFVNPLIQRTSPHASPQGKKRNFYNGSPGSSPKSGSRFFSLKSLSPKSRNRMDYYQTQSNQIESPIDENTSKLKTQAISLDKIISGLTSAYQEIYDRDNEFCEKFQRKNFLSVPDCYQLYESKLHLSVSKIKVQLIQVIKDELVEPYYLFMLDNIEKDDYEKITKYLEESIMAIIRTDAVVKNQNIEIFKNESEKNLVIEQLENSCVDKLRLQNLPVSLQKFITEKTVEQCKNYDDVLMQIQNLKIEMHDYAKAANSNLLKQNFADHIEIKELISKFQNMGVILEFKILKCLQQKIRIKLDTDNFCINIIAFQDLLIELDNILTTKIIVDENTNENSPDKLVYQRCEQICRAINLTLCQLTVFEFDFSYIEYKNISFKELIKLFVNRAGCDCNGFRAFMDNCQKKNIMDFFIVDPTLLNIITFYGYCGDKELATEILEILAPNLDKYAQKECQIGVIADNANSEFSDVSDEDISTHSFGR